MRQAPNSLMHLSIAHSLWKQHLPSKARVIDATMGNGHDFLYLAQMLEGHGELIGYDVQEKALVQTKKRLETSLPFTHRQGISCTLRCHSKLAETDVDLIVYNLGYLPGADKSLTTQMATTIESLECALTALKKTGALSITTYPGHEEGLIEHQAVMKWLEKQDLQVFHFWRVDRRRSPHLFFAKRRAQTQK